MSKNDDFTRHGVIETALKLEGPTCRLHLDSANDASLARTELDFYNSAYAIQAFINLHPHVSQDFFSYLAGPLMDAEFGRLIEFTQAGEAKIELPKGKITETMSVAKEVCELAGWSLAMRSVGSSGTVSLTLTKI